MKISVVISAYNEEKKIERCLKSVLWADEVILVDNQSIDNTFRIAQKYADKIFSRPNSRMLNVNKNYGFKKASGEWILSLDADEIVEEKLREEIGYAINNSQTDEGKKICGFYIPRKNIIFKKWIRHTGWYPDYQLRLFKKGKGSFPENHVHEKIIIEGETKKMKNHLLHENYETVSQFIQKLDLYTESEAETFISEGNRRFDLQVFEMMRNEFLKRYFAEGGYKDDLHGLILSYLMSFYYLVVYAKIWEKSGFPESKLLLTDFKKDFEKNSKEIEYWLKKISGGGIIKEIKSRLF